MTDMSDEIIDEIVAPLRRLLKVLNEHQPWIMVTKLRNEVTDALWGPGAAEFLEQTQAENPELTFEELVDV